jgi:serine/threonine protein kinase
VANAQDEAFQRLLAQRGVVSEDVLARAKAQQGGSLVHTLVRGRMVPAQVASGILRELARGSFGCAQCRQVLPYDALSFLEHLSCPRCHAPLQFRPEAPPPLGLEGEGNRRSTNAYRRGSGIGRTIGPYTILEELGRGSNGVVFKAERPGIKRPFALKLLLSNSFEDEEAIARFKLEAAVASKLDETGVIGVYDIGRDAGHYYYAMEYCPGATLQDVIQQGPLPAEKAARILAQLAHTTHHAHEMGVIHRDLKPANVILDERNGNARITDFGLARAPELGNNLTRTGDVLGTPYYMAPEQLRGGAKVEPSIDTYALGVILYECLCGERPFEAATVLELSKLVQEATPTPLAKRVPGLPEELAAICRRAMAKRP